MKAKLNEFRVMPFGPMELRMMPPGELYVQIHLTCDAKMAAKLADFFHGHGVEGAAKALGPAPKIIEGKKPDGV